MALGLTASALSSYATTVQVIDALNLSGQGPLLISNSGGGNQHGQAQDSFIRIQWRSSAHPLSADTVQQSNNRLQVLTNLRRYGYKKSKPAARFADSAEITG